MGDWEDRYGEWEELGEWEEDPQAVRTEEELGEGPGSVRIVLV